MSIYIFDQVQFDEPSSFSASRSGAASNRATIGGGRVAQRGLAHPLAALGARAETFGLSLPAEHVADFLLLLRGQAQGLLPFATTWPVTDLWGLPGEIGQRTVFFISRWFIWNLIPFAKLGDEDNLEPTFIPDDGSGAVPLTVITTGTPGSAEVLIADTYTDFEDTASYRVETGDLMAHGPGYFSLTYHPARHVTFSPQTRTVSGHNRLVTSWSVTETLPSATRRAGLS